MGQISIGESSLKWVRFQSALTHGSYLDDRGRTNGWGEVEWLLTPHALLNGRPPCELLADDAGAVVEAARIEYIEDSSAGGF